MTFTKPWPEGFADLADLPEDERIGIIGHYVVDHGKVVGVCVEDEQSKIERYVAKVRERFPTVALLAVAKGPVPKVVTIKFGPEPQ